MTDDYKSCELLPERCQSTMNPSRLNLKLLACKALVEYSVDSEDYYPNLNISLASLKGSFSMLQQFRQTFDDWSLFTLLYCPDVLSHEVMLLHGRFKGNQYNSWLVKAFLTWHLTFL